MMQIFRGLALFVMLLAATPAVHAQGCAACKANVAQAGPDAQRGLRRGIAVLLIPSLIIFTGVVVLAYKYREATHD
jgi:hypothetical protein